MWGAGPLAMQTATDPESGDFPLSKRFRTAFSVEQLKALEYSFRLCHYPDVYTRELLARYTNIDENRIQVSVQNLGINVTIVNGCLFADMVPEQKSKVP